MSGSGISEESGIPTFRGSNGLWEGHRLEEVASPEAWNRDPELVLRFYNMRRRACREAEPNAAHRAIVLLEEYFDVTVVTQNVDDLHERAGSSDVLHLHGELMYARSTGDPQKRFYLDEADIHLGDLDPSGAQLRPDIVWFGEEVSAIPSAIAVTALANIFIVIGTSLVVYPAASLIHYVPEGCAKFMIDPKIPKETVGAGFMCIEKKATQGMQELLEMLIKRFELKQSG